MIYQINGKKVTKKQISQNMKKFVKIVTIPGKLTNYITVQNELETSNSTISFWQGARSLWNRIFNKFIWYIYIKTFKFFFF